MSARTIAVLAVAAAWVVWLVVVATADWSCVDPATGRQGIDALGHCSGRAALGSLTIAEKAVWLTVVLPPVVLAVAFGGRRLATRRRTR